MRVPLFAKLALRGLAPGLPLLLVVMMMILHQVRHGRQDKAPGGLHFGLVRSALCIFAPRFTPNKLLLILSMLCSQVRVAAWPLAAVAEERQHAIHDCLGSRAALLASPGPISPHSH
jgi:hypothetical protein